MSALPYAFLPSLLLAYFPAVIGYDMDSKKKSTADMSILLRCLGTIDRSEWKGGVQDQLFVEELIEHLHYFNEVVTYKRVGV